MKREICDLTSPARHVEATDMRGLEAFTPPSKHLECFYTIFILGFYSNKRTKG